ncbi:MAG: hypothetical protein COV71_03990, partial [Candidatus Omnitrophica bacterium CG11_big_fil_rev_8_21_14_0_20_41_12]
FVPIFTIITGLWAGGIDVAVCLPDRQGGNELLFLPAALLGLVIGGSRRWRGDYKLETIFIAQVQIDDLKILGDEIAGFAKNVGGYEQNATRYAGEQSDWFRANLPLGRERLSKLTNTHLILARDNNDAVLGFVFVFIEHNAGHIRRIVVHPEAQRRGIGRELLVEGVSKLRQSGAEIIEVAIQGDNVGSLAFHEKVLEELTGIKPERKVEFTGGPYILEVNLPQPLILESEVDAAIDLNQVTVKQDIAGLFYVPPFPASSEEKFDIDAWIIKYKGEEIGQLAIGVNTKNKHAHIMTVNLAREYQNRSIGKHVLRGIIISKYADYRISVDTCNKHLISIVNGILEERLGTTGTSKEASQARVEAVRELKKRIDAGEIQKTNELKGRVDLHHHTIYSDGNRSPAAIVYEAWKAGALAVGIVDHNTFGGIEEALAAGEILGIRVIAGVEITAVEMFSCLSARENHDERTMLDSFHFLGYLPFKTAKEYRKWRGTEEAQKFINNVEEFREYIYNEKNIDALAERLIRKEIISRRGVEDYLFLHDHHNLNKAGLVHILKEATGIQKDADIYEKYFGETISADDSGLSLRCVMSYICKAGGISMLAHPVRLAPAEEEALEKARELLETHGYFWRGKEVFIGLSGLEAYHWKQSPEFSRKLLNIADVLGMVYTVGTDNHNSRRPVVMGLGDVGDNAEGNIPQEASLGRIEAMDARFAMVREFNAGKDKPRYYPGALDIKVIQGVNSDKIKNLWEYIKQGVEELGLGAWLIDSIQIGFILGSLGIVLTDRIRIDDGLSMIAPEFNMDGLRSRQFQLIINDILRHEVGHFRYGLDEEAACGLSYDYFKGNPQAAGAFILACKRFRIKLLEDYIKDIRDIILSDNLMSARNEAYSEPDTGIEYAQWAVHDEQWYQAIEFLEDALLGYELFSLSCADVNERKLFEDRLARAEEMYWNAYIEYNGLHPESLSTDRIIDILLDKRKSVLAVRLLKDLESSERMAAFEKICSSAYSLIIKRKKNFYPGSPNKTSVFRLVSVIEDFLSGVYEDKDLEGEVRQYALMFEDFVKDIREELSEKLAQEASGGLASHSRIGVAGLTLAEENFGRLRGTLNFKKGSFKIEGGKSAKINQIAGSIFNKQKIKALKKIVSRLNTEIISRHPGLKRLNSSDINIELSGDMERLGEAVPGLVRYHRAIWDRAPPLIAEIILVEEILHDYYPGQDQLIHDVIDEYIIRHDYPQFKKAVVQAQEKGLIFDGDWLIKLKEQYELVPVYRALSRNVLWRALDNAKKERAVARLRAVQAHIAEIRNTISRNPRLKQYENNLEAIYVVGTFLFKDNPEDMDLIIQVKGNIPGAGFELKEIPLSGLNKSPKEIFGTGISYLHVRFTNIYAPQEKLLGARIYTSGILLAGRRIVNGASNEELLESAENMVSSGLESKGSHLALAVLMAREAGVDVGMSDEKINTYFEIDNLYGNLPSGMPGWKIYQEVSEIIKGIRSAAKQLNTYKEQPVTAYIRARLSGTGFLLGLWEYRYSIVIAAFIFWFFLVNPDIACGAVLLTKTIDPDDLSPMAKELFNPRMKKEVRKRNIAPGNLIRNFIVKISDLKKELSLSCEEAKEVVAAIMLKMMTEGRLTGMDNFRHQSLNIKYPEKSYIELFLIAQYFNDALDYMRLESKRRILRAARNNKEIAAIVNELKEGKRVIDLPLIKLLRLYQVVELLEVIHEKENKSAKKDVFFVVGYLRVNMLVTDLRMHNLSPLLFSVAKRKRIALQEGSMKYPNKESALDELDRKEKVGISITAQKLSRYDTTLYKAVLDFEILLPSRNQKKYANRRAVIRALDERTKKGLANYARALKKDDSVLYRETRNYGIELSLLPRQKYPTKESVENEIERRQRFGLPITPVKLQKSDFTLYKAALDFGIELPREELFTYPTVESVKQELSRRESLNIPNNPYALQKGKNRDIALYDAAKRLDVELSYAQRRKYPSKEAAEEALDDREASGLLNYAKVLDRENPALYDAVLEYGIVLPKKSRYRYPTVESVNEALSKRENQGMLNTVKNLLVEDRALFNACRRFNIELPSAKFKYPTKKIAEKELMRRFEEGLLVNMYRLRQEDHGLYTAVRRFGIQFPIDKNNSDLFKAGGRWPFLQRVLYDRIGRGFIGQALVPALIESGLFMGAGSLLLFWAFGLPFALDPPQFIIFSAFLVTWYVLHLLGDGRLQGYRFQHAFTRDKITISFGSILIFALSAFAGDIVFLLYFLAFLHAYINSKYSNEPQPSNPEMAAVFRHFNDLKAIKKSALKGIKLIIMDLDDTLAELKQAVSEENLRMINELLKLGVRIAIITGDRSSNVEKRFFDSLREELAKEGREDALDYLDIFTFLGAYGFGFDEQGSRIEYYEAVINSKVADRLEKKISADLQGLGLEVETDYDIDRKGIKENGDTLLFTVRLYKDGMRRKTEIMKQLRGLIGGACFEVVDSATAVDVCKFDKSLAADTVMLKSGVKPEETLIIGNEFSEFGADRTMMTEMTKGAKVINVGADPGTRKLRKGIMTLQAKGPDGTAIPLGIILEKLNRKDTAYFGWDEKRVNAKMKEYMDKGLMRKPLSEEASFFQSAWEQYLSYILEEGMVNKGRAPPRLLVIDTDDCSEEETFGATYYKNNNPFDGEDDTFVIAHSLINHPTYNLTGILIHELNDGTHQENKQLEDKFLGYLMANSRAQGKLWEGIGEPSSDWLGMNLVAGVILKARLPAALDDILPLCLDRLSAHGLAPDAELVKGLLRRLTQAGLLTQEDGRYGLAVSPRILAVKTDNAFYIHNEIANALNAELDLERLITDYAQALQLWPFYPVESRWPVLRAVALLDKCQQERLIGFLNSKPGLKEFPLVDAILLMLQEKPEPGWLKNYAPNLQQRTIYYVASECWEVAGGLGRVGQYHTSAMKELAGDQAKITTIEPYYPYRFNLKGEQEKVDYSRLPIPVDGLLDLPNFEYKVIVKGKEASAQVYRGRNRLGIEVYLIKDKDDYYTRMLYKYGEFGTASWEEFSEFFSRAALELVHKLEEEKEKKQGKDYKGPVIIANDGQLGLLPLFRRLHYANDEVFKSSLVWFVTHTYRNRGMLKGDYGQFTVGQMGVPGEWSPVFRRSELWDFTSAGLRSADATSGVSVIQRDEVSPYDPEVSSVAITNGDNLGYSSGVFREILQELYGSQVDISQPAARKILEAKKIAKQRLGLNPEQIVISYSGRLVPEKAGRLRAFTDSNIEALVEAGAQVMIYGNVQENEESKRIHRELKHLEGHLNSKDYSGKLVVKTGWGLPEQVALLAATDLQVQDSDRKTGAAEYTEADVSANAGLQFGPVWLEGIIQRQGIVLDRNTPGSGNTIIPKDASPQSYREAFLWAMNLFANKREDFAEYQAASVRLSRVLEARLAGAEYLRQFGRAIERKDNPLGLLQNYIQGDISAAGYLKSQKIKEDLTDELMRNPAIATPCSSSSEKIKLFALQAGGEVLAVAIDLGEFKYLYEKGLKSWTQAYPKDCLSLISKESQKNLSDIYQIQDVITGAKYGEYTVEELLTKGLPIGVPYPPGIQIARLIKTTRISEREKEIGGKRIIDILSSAAKGEMAEGVGLPVEFLFKLFSNYSDKPGDLKDILQEVTHLSPESAKGMFKESLGAVMAMAATLAPGLLEDMQDWDRDIYALLDSVVNSDLNKEIFLKGKLTCHKTDKNSALVFSRDYSGRRIFIPIHFTKRPYNLADGKVWFRVLDMGSLGYRGITSHKIYDYTIGRFYPLTHTGEELSKDGWSIGIPVESQRKDFSSFLQHGWHFQILEFD